MPASDQVFEFIMFRGNDIKDLHVSQVQQPPQNSALPNDPAILSTVRVPWVGVEWSEVLRYALLCHAVRCD